MEHNKRYLLVIQDYFTKWVEAFPLPNEQAVTMARVTRRPALGRTVRIFNALSGVRRSIKPDAYLSSFLRHRLEERSFFIFAGLQHNIQS